MSPAKCFKSVITHIQFKKAAEFARRHLALRPTCIFPETRKTSPSGNTETCKHLPTIFLKTWQLLIWPNMHNLPNHIQWSMGPFDLGKRWVYSQGQPLQMRHFKLQVVLPFPNPLHQHEKGSASSKHRYRCQNGGMGTLRETHKLSPTESPNPHCSKKK